MWEKEVGYSRAVKVGNNVFVSGTVAVDEAGNIVGLGNAYEQSKFIFDKIEKSLIEAGAGLPDVVRTRMYVVDINLWKELAKAHSEYFSTIKPAATMVEVSSLIEPDLLVEIEVDAVITNNI
jgi:enamine deaminase RidA (YjgF/YER057c/UK114 family)